MNKTNAAIWPDSAQFSINNDRVSRLYVKTFFRHGLKNTLCICVSISNDVLTQWSIIDGLLHQPKRPVRCCSFFIFTCFNFFFFHNTHLSDRNIDGIEKTVRVLVIRACLPLWMILVVSMLYFTRPWHVLICHWEIWQHPIQIIHFVLLELQAPYCFPLITFNSSWVVLEFIYTEDWPTVYIWTYIS